MIKKNKKIPGISLITLVNKESSVSEKYRMIRTSIQFAILDRNLNSLVITSSGSNEGKSTTAANLSIVFADSGLEVLLVDADLRRPTVDQTFKVNNSLGLSNFLVTKDFDISDGFQDSGISGLTILTSGPIPPNPSELLGTKKMTELIEDTKREFDLVIFDMPPAGVVTDAQIVASQTDGTLLVIRHGTTEKKAIMEVQKSFDTVNANVIGAVYNGVNKLTQDFDYYYSN